ncbi:hypothetical protein SUGI_0908390 [Cryptomeria japonica]|nr:hypothetical protein SUGI_0908390 [Cryptomeria japonica]
MIASRVDALERKYFPNEDVTKGTKQENNKDDDEDYEHFVDVKEEDYQVTKTDKNINSQSLESSDFGRLFDDLMKDGSNEDEEINMIVVENEEARNEIRAVEMIATNSKIGIQELEVEELLGQELIREHLSPEGEWRIYRDSNTINLFVISLRELYVDDPDFQDGYEAYRNSINSNIEQYIIFVLPKDFLLTCNRFCIPRGSMRENLLMES